MLGHETTSELAARAAQAALMVAGLRANEIDLLISAAAVPQQPIPTQAVLIAHHLGLDGCGIPAYDMNATCLGFLTSLDLVSDAITSGRYQRILLVACDAPSCGLNWQDPVNSVLFGDGAAAAIIESASPEHNTGIIASLFQTYPEGRTFCQLRAGGTAVRLENGWNEFAAAGKYEMNGQAAYKVAAQKFPTFLETLLAKAGIALSEINLVIPHQASRQGMDHLVERLGIPREKIVDIYDEVGNQVSASIPSALHAARQTGQLQTGMTVLMAGTAAGITLGGMVLRL